MKRLLSVICALLLAAGVAASAAEQAPDELVKSVAQEVIEIIKQDKDIQAGNHKRILDLVDTKVLPHFDFVRMTRLAVGRNWSKANDAQRQSLTAEFRQTLVRTYSTSLSQYKNQTINYKPLNMQPGDVEATVKTVVNQPSGQSIPIDYKMEKTAQGWKVYDISVDAVSLVTNYRSSFNDEVSKGGIDGLIHALSERNRSGKPDAAGKAAAVDKK